MTDAYINRIATGVPPHDMHEEFVRYAQSLFETDRKRSGLLGRMIDRLGVEHRYSCLAPAPDWEVGPALDADAFYIRGRFPDTAARMRLFEARAPELAASTIERLKLGSERDKVTHFFITCCTGFSAPGLDHEVMERCRSSGFGRANHDRVHGLSRRHQCPQACSSYCAFGTDSTGIEFSIWKVCTLHFKETTDLAQICPSCFSETAAQLA